MPITFAPFDLSTVGVGQSGDVDISAIAGGMGVPYNPHHSTGTLRLHNESSSGLKILLPNSGQSFYLPAGGWNDCSPYQGENSIQFTVLYSIQSPPVSLLLVTYYMPGEPVPPMTTLGNSAVAGTTTVSGNIIANALQSSGTASGTVIITISPTGDIGSVFQVDSAGNVVIGDASHSGSLSVQFGGSTLSSASISNFIHFSGQEIIIDPPASIVVPTNNSTIPYNAAWIRCNPSSAVTGLIMTPGVTLGDFVTIANISSTGANTMTFAGSGSHMGGGSTTGINPGHEISCHWDTTSSQWIVCKSA